MTHDANCPVELTLCRSGFFGSVVKLDLLRSAGILVNFVKHFRQFVAIWVLLYMLVVYQTLKPRPWA